MAEFFSECLQKIKQHLGPTSKQVAPVHSYFKNTAAYNHILENNFDSAATVKLYTGKDYPPIETIVQTWKYFYACDSIKDLGRLVIIEAEGAKMTDRGEKKVRNDVYF